MVNIWFYSNCNSLFALYANENRFSKLKPLEIGKHLLSETILLPTATA